MTKGYVIFTEQVTDPEGLTAYAAAAMPSVVAAGAVATIVGAPQRVCEGQWHGDTTVVLEFPSLHDATTWYDSADYQSVIGQRHRAATSNVAIFEGFVPPNPA